MSDVQLHLTLPIGAASILKNGEAGLELISDPQGLQINVLLEGSVHTRVVIGFDHTGDHPAQIVLQRWEPQHWEKHVPDEVIVLATL